MLSTCLLVVDVELEHDEVAGLVQAAHDVERVARRRGVGLDREVEQVEPLVQSRRDLRVRVAARVSVTVQVSIG